MKPNVSVPQLVAVAVGQVVDPLAVEQDRAGVGRVEQAEHVQQRALARAAGPDDRHELAVLDLQVDPPEHRDRRLPLPVALLQPARREVDSPSSLAFRGDSVELAGCHADVATATRRAHSNRSARTGCSLAARWAGQMLADGRR